MESIKQKDKDLACCLAVFGTGSDVGKSIITAALCRHFVKQGIRVAPFKAQNMSNNSGVTPEGLEMGRAQIVQAEAARIPPHVDMNPILLKPTSEIGSQVVLLGEAIGNSMANEYYDRKKRLFSESCKALTRLRKKYELIIMEGAGSCAEVNLMQHDIVNFHIADYASAPVILVADIHRGGVFAQIIGTLECLSQKQQNQVAGFIINRFRGDIDLFEDGKKWIEQKTEKKVFGILPWFTHINIEAEDSVVIENPKTRYPENSNDPAIAVIRLPHISNFTDFDPLSCIKGLNLHFIEKVQELLPFKAVILPGSKNTRFDLDWLKTTGWSEKLKDYANHNGHILGICGGYQMMGHYVHDPDGLEGAPGRTAGLGLLPVETVLKAPKTTTLTQFYWQDIKGAGYEIHMGKTERFSDNTMFSVFERNSLACNDEDGCIVNESRIMGTYMHGLFDTPDITKRWLATIGLDHLKVAQTHGPVTRDREYDLLSEHFKKHIDTDGIFESLRDGVRM